MLLQYLQVEQNLTGAKSHTRHDPAKKEAIHFHFCRLGGGVERHITPDIIIVIFTDIIDIAKFSYIERFFFRSNESIVF